MKINEQDDGLGGGGVTGILCSLQQKRGMEVDPTQ